MIEVHITNIHAREIPPALLRLEGREGGLCGFGVEGYALAIDGLAAMIGPRRKS